MDRKKILQWITFILNMIVYLAVINVVLLAGMRTVSITGLCNPWVSRGAFLLLEALVLWFLSRYLFRLTVQTTPEERKERGEQLSRTVTALRYAGLAILGGMALLIGLKFIGCFDIIYAGWPLLLFPVAVAGAAVLGGLHPERRGSDRSVSLLAWALLAGIPFALLLLGVLTTIPGNFEYRTSELRPWRYFSLSTENIRRSFPPDSKNCRIRGNNGFGFGYFWSCECPEEAFLRFARENGYEIHEGSSTDANGHRLKGFFSFDMFRGIGLERSPESFYYYNNRWANGGGWTLLYDRNSHRLYGNHATR